MYSGNELNYKLNANYSAPVAVTVTTNFNFYTIIGSPYKQYTVSIDKLMTGDGIYDNIQYDITYANLIAWGFAGRTVSLAVIVKDKISGVELYARAPWINYFIIH